MEKSQIIDAIKKLITEAETIQELEEMKAILETRLETVKQCEKGKRLFLTPKDCKLADNDLATKHYYIQYLDSNEPWLNDFRKTFIKLPVEVNVYASGFSENKPINVTVEPIPSFLWSKIDIPNTVWSRVTLDDIVFPGGKLTSYPARRILDPFHITLRGNHKVGWTELQYEKDDSKRYSYVLGTDFPNPYVNLTFVFYPTSPPQAGWRGYVLSSRGHITSVSVNETDRRRIICDEGMSTERQLCWNRFTMYALMNAEDKEQSSGTKIELRTSTISKDSIQPKLTGIPQHVAEWHELRNTRTMGSKGEDSVVLRKEDKDAVSRLEQID